MRPAITEGFSHRDAFGVERVSDAADRGLRAFLVDVPPFEMLDRAGVHHDQRRMDDRPGIHQRARQRVAAGLDHAWKGAADYVERMRGGGQRKHADRQPLGANGDGDLERPVLSRQPRQRAGFGKADARVIACLVRRPGEDHRTKSRRRQEHHLAVGELRRDQPGDIGLREGRGGADDQFCIADGICDVRRDHRQLHLVTAVDVLHDNARARRPLFATYVVAPPQPDVMALQGKISRGRERAVAAAEYCDTHGFYSHSAVMPGLVPGIHVPLMAQEKTWIAGTIPAMTSSWNRSQSCLSPQVAAA